MAANGGVILVLVAHSGRALHLDVQPSTRVDAVQHALVQFTGIPVADQIAMYQGARLDPTRMLGAYRLPVDPAAASLEDHPVFLYCRSYLKPGAALPPQEALPPQTVQVPPLAEVSLAHPLHSAASPLVRALPDYERHFQHHLATTRAYWEVAKNRLQRCRQLLSEQEVQARAADAARANVEAHYGHILASFNQFLDKYRAQAAAHAQLLATFPSDLAALEAIELHPALQELHPAPPPPSGSHPQQQQHPPSGQHPQQSHPHQHQQQALASSQHQTHGQHAQHPGFPGDPAQQAHHAQQPGGGEGRPLPVSSPPRRLSDLYPVARLREWAETCARSHASFGSKVAELEALFGALRRDVEGLLQQAPSVDLDSLGRQLAEHEALLDEHSSMVQVLSKDLRTVRALVEDVVRQLGSAAGGGGAAAGGGGGGGPGGGLAGGGAGGLRHGALHDAAAAMEAIHETHRNRVLPRLAQLDGQLASFAASIEASKVAMARDVVGQLQRISGQQSRIRDMRHKLAAFAEVLGRQEAAFAELRAVHRLPAAYRALLAEAVRRAAWHQLYCGQAGRLSDHMARFREKEAGRRAAFTAQVSRYLPPDLLSRAGLASEPPACAVTVPPPPLPIIAVQLPDLQRLAYLDERRLAASTSLSALVGLRASASASASMGSPASVAAAAMAAAASSPAGGAQAGPGRPLPQSHPSLGASPDGGALAGVLASQQHPHQHQIHQQHPHHPHHHHHSHHQHQQHHHHAAQQPGSASASRLAGAASVSGAAFPGTVAVLDADPGPPADPLHALELENARLRAELANHIAAAAIRELTETAPAAATTAGPSMAAGAGGDGAQQLAQTQQAAESPSGQAQAGMAAAPPQRRVSGGGGAATAAAAALTGAPAAVAARRDPAELVAAMQRALGMKDDLIRQQQREMEAAAARAAAYEQRIAALEAALAGPVGLTEAEAAPAGPIADSIAAGVSGGGGASPSRQGAEGSSGDGGASAGSGRGVAAEVAVWAEEQSGATRGDAAARLREEPPVATGPWTARAGLQGPGTPAGGSAGVGGEAGSTRASSGGGAGAIAAAAAASAAVPSSPFAQPVAQLQKPQEEPRPSSPAVAPRAGSIAAALAAAALRGEPPPAAISAEPAGQAAPAAATVSAPAAVGREQSAAPPPQRGSSGPQAIPAGLGARHRAAAMGSVVGRGDSLHPSPYEHRIPMAMGSLPFATSLPAGPGSLLPGRLASSPGGGIGLGLALGFGLTSLAEAPSERRAGSREFGRHGGGGDSGRSSRHESESGRGGGDGEIGARVSFDVTGISGISGMERAVRSPSLRARRRSSGGDSGDDGNGSSGGSSNSNSNSSSGLQFQPTWSVMQPGSPRALSSGRAAPRAHGSAGQGQGLVGSAAGASGSGTGGVATGLLSRSLAEQQQQQEHQEQEDEVKEEQLRDELGAEDAAPRQLDEQEASADSGAVGSSSELSGREVVREPESGSGRAEGPAVAAAGGADATDALAAAAAATDAATAALDGGGDDGHDSRAAVEGSGDVAGGGLDHSDGRADEVKSEEGAGDDDVPVPDIDEIMDGAWEVTSAAELPPEEGEEETASGRPTQPAAPAGEQSGPGASGEGGGADSRTASPGETAAGAAQLAEGAGEGGASAFGIVGYQDQEDQDQQDQEQEQGGAEGTIDGVDLAASGAGGGGTVASSVVALEASQSQSQLLLEAASSGYESVGSMMSAAAYEGE